MKKIGMKKIGIKAIQSELRKCAFSPDELGAWKIISDTVDTTRNSTYYELRAIELIVEAMGEASLYNENIVLAIQLLILAKIKKNDIRPY